MTRQSRARANDDEDPFADWDGDNASELSSNSLDLRHDRNEGYRWGYSIITPGMVRGLDNSVQEVQIVTSG